jgi:hypothetical protein
MTKDCVSLCNWLEFNSLILEPIGGTHFFFYVGGTCGIGEGIVRRGIHAPLR